VDDDQVDMNAALMVDGNAVAGRLQQIFGRDMTAAVTRCAGCASDAKMGALMAFVRGPGVVLRCPTCQAAIVRIVETSAAIYLDARGAAYFRMSSPPRADGSILVERSEEP
jgi:hypothetical protein